MPVLAFYEKEKTMKTIGLGVNPDIVKRVAEGINQIFSSIPLYWKRDIFDRATVVVVPQGDGENMRLASLDDCSFVVPVYGEFEDDLDEIVASAITMYIAALINVDEVVQPIVSEVVDVFGIPDEGVIDILALWFIEKDDPQLMTECARSMCEEVDRRLAGLYVPKVSIEHGLSIQ